jgi:putative nucleotidyltransferase with HDIG domain
LAGVAGSVARRKRLPRIGLLRVALASLVVLLVSGGWTVTGTFTAYLAAGCAGILGVALILGWPQTFSYSPFTLVFLDSILISVLIYGTGGGESPFFPLYLLASLGLVLAPGVLASFAGAATLVGGYLAATAGSSGTFDVLFFPETLFGVGIIALFCVLAGSLGIKLHSLRATVRSSSTSAVSARESEERSAVLLSSIAPILRILDVGGVLDWMALTVRDLLDAPFVHVALLDGANHRTHVEGNLDVYPSWWHPEIQRILLWSSRTGEVLREEVTVCGIEGLVAVPIVSSEGHGLGALIVGGKALDGREEHSLTSLAAELASVVEESEEAPGGRESVSGLPNQASLKRMLGKEISEGNAITLLMIQMDCLREYRRAYGIFSEDQLLGKIGNRLNQEYQRIFHYGNNLVVVSKSSSKPRAQKAALRARQIIARLTDDAAVSLDVSVGFVLVSSEGGEEPDLVLDAAAGAVSRAEAEPEKLFGASLEEILESTRDRGDIEGKERTVLTLLGATRLRDPYLGVHMRAVSQLSIRVGSEMGLSREQLEDLRIGALLHDVGKIGIPDTILHKPGPLACEEYEVVKTHTTLGAEILAKEADLSEVVSAAKHHHERFDGEGYPDGLRGEDIPLMARIVCVADALDSMVRDKAYQRGVSEQAALDEIVRNSGTQFDPQVVEALVLALERSDGWRAGFG